MRWMKPLRHAVLKSNAIYHMISYEIFPNVYKNFSIRTPYVDDIIGESE